MQDIAFTIYSLLVLIMSVAVHEVAHGYVAFLKGDVTAKYQGRLTLNPVKHFDLVGSFIVPALAFFTSGFAFGWAKPVPINPYNFKNPRWDGFAVAIAGPLSNLAIALVLGLLLRFMGAVDILTDTLVIMLGRAAFVNMNLAIFNLIPVPPFDGFKVFSAFVDLSHETIANLDRYGFIFILLVVFYLWDWFSPIVFNIFELITGLS